MPRKRKRRTNSRIRPYKTKRMDSRKVELKFYDELNVNSFNPASLGGTIWSSSLNNIFQGVDDQERIGRRIRVKEIALTMFFQIASTLDSDNATDAFRVILYMDRQANGTAAVPGTILHVPISVVSYYNLTNSDRIRILYDKTFDISAQAGNDSNFAKTEFVRKMVIKLNEPVIFSGASGVDANVRSRNFGILCVSSNVQCLCSIQSRVRYTDQ